MIRQAARRTDEVPARRWQEAESQTGETGPKEVAETLTSAFEQMTSGAEGTNLKGKAQKTQMSIESRLESLARMFTADKDTPAEEDAEEEES